MSPMSPRDLALRWFHEVWNERNPDTIREMLAPDAVGHTEGGEMVGPEAFIELFHRPFLEAFPDVKVTPQAVIESGTDVAVRWSACCTHSGNAFGIEATGRKLTFQGVSWFKVRDGIFVEGWDHWNFSGFMQALAGGTGTASILVENAPDPEPSNVA
jgi:steroid delta-isomerase-like uncharacterized protein